jgi:hypothetical protein
LAVLALVLALPGGRGQAVSPQGEPAYQAYLPALTKTQFLYIPLAAKSQSVPVPLANPSFENEQWYTDPQTGNQHPAGWTFFSPAAGQVMPFPTKNADGSLVPAISDGPGEYIHKYWWQLPQNEWLGMPRGLIVDGKLVYKAFGFYIQQALQFSQVITGNPGDYLRVTGYILGESHEIGPFENDDFIASVQLGAFADTRERVEMVQNHDVPGNERAWNRFEVVAPVPGSGQLTLTIIVQQNWRNRTDFFLDNFRAERMVVTP